MQKPSSRTQPADSYSLCALRLETAVESVRRAAPVSRAKRSAHAKRPRATPLLRARGHDEEILQYPLARLVERREPRIELGEAGRAVDVAREEDRRLAARDPCGEESARARRVRAYAVESQVIEKKRQRRRHIVLAGPADRSAGGRFGHPGKRGNTSRIRSIAASMFASEFA